MLLKEGAESERLDQMAPLDAFGVPQGGQVELVGGDRKEVAELLELMQLVLESASPRSLIASGSAVVTCPW